MCEGLDEANSCAGSREGVCWAIKGSLPPGCGWGVLLPAQPWHLGRSPALLPAASSFRNWYFLIQMDKMCFLHKTLINLVYKVYF